MTRQELPRPPRGRAECEHSCPQQLANGTTTIRRAAPRESRPGIEKMRAPLPTYFGRREKLDGEDVSRFNCPHPGTAYRNGRETPHAMNFDFVLKVGFNKMQHESITS